MLDNNRPNMAPIVNISFLSRSINRIQILIRGTLRNYDSFNSRLDFLLKNGTVTNSTRTCRERRRVSDNLPFKVVNEH